MSQRAPKHSDPVVGRILNQAELAAQRSSAATRARIRVGMVAAVVVLALAAGWARSGVGFESVWSGARGG